MVWVVAASLSSMDMHPFTWREGGCATGDFPWALARNLCIHRLPATERRVIIDLPSQRHLLTKFRPEFFCRGLALLDDKRLPLVRFHKGLYVPPFVFMTLANGTLPDRVNEDLGEI